MTHNTNLHLKSFQKCLNTVKMTLFGLILKLYKTLPELTVSMTIDMWISYTYIYL